LLIDIAAMVCTGISFAGIFLGLRKVMGERLPKWALPAVIGAGMVGYSIWSEYSWYYRVTGVLPGEVAVVLVPEDRSPLRPWTYLFPTSTRFMALDRTVMIVSAAHPSFRMADLMVVERWMPTRRVPLAFDCAGGRHADLSAGAAMAADGTLTGTRWVAAAPGDAMQGAACADQAKGSAAYPTPVRHNPRGGATGPQAERARA